MQTESIMKAITNLNPNDNFVVKAVFIENYIQYLVDIREALNIHSQNIQSDIDELKTIYEDCTGIMIREPPYTTQAHLHLSVSHQMIQSLLTCGYPVRTYQLIDKSMN